MSLFDIVEPTDGDFRVVLNATGATHSMAARSVQGGSGAAVQHIAYATTDIMRAAQNARLNKLEILAAPPNYYDDLKARLGLFADLIHEPRQSDIFYDKNDSGELLQFFYPCLRKAVFL